MPDRTPRTTEFGDGITAIDTDLLRPVFDASHLLVENGRAAFIDPAGTQGHLWEMSEG